MIKSLKNEKDSENIENIFICLQCLLKYGENLKNNNNEINFVLIQIELNNGFEIINYMLDYSNYDITKLYELYLENFFLEE